MSAAFKCRAGLRLFLVLLSSSVGIAVSWGQSKPALLKARLAPGLELARAARTLRVSVRDQAAFRQWLTQKYPQATVVAEPGHPNLLRVQGATASALAACPTVTFVEAADRVAQPERQLNGADLTLNKVSTTHARYPQLTGKGLTVSVKEDPFDIEDIDFKGRLVNPDPQAKLLNSHATMMATLIAGGGNSSPNGKGGAWQARIAQSSYDNLLPDDGATLAAQGVSVQNHSYGVSVENFYGLEARAYDQQVRQYPALLHVFSSGNSGTQPAAAGPYAALSGVANLTGQFKNSKNTLSVGATDALGQVVPLSSRGPAADGRVKPELVAFGDGGTSDAAALVSGISLLVQQAYRDQRGTVPSASLVKAALLNAADDTGRPNVDFVAGYGQADALGAVQAILENRYAEATATQNQERVFMITVPAGTHRLKATLAWTDPEAAPDASPTLINDLDLKLTNTATNQQWLPWTLSTFPHLDSLALPARRRPNHLDNTEQITLDLPAAGTYELRVRGFGVPQGPQAFSLVYEFESGLTWVHPSEARNVRAAESAWLRWQWAGPATAARLEYRLVNQATWTTLSPSVNLQEQSFRWAVPEAVEGMAQVRLLTGAGAVASDTFFIARPLALNVAYTCPDETLLTWAKVPGATQYQVYVLGATNLQPFRLLPDTALFLTAAQAAAQYYAVAPVSGGRVGERGSISNVTQEAYGCYIRSFLPQQLVTDTVRFNLNLGTTYQLRAVVLERRNADGSFQPVQTQRLIAGTSLVLTDPAPVPGRSEYRASVVLASNRTFYSQTEEVYFIRNTADVQVYPVPVTSGEPLNLVGPRDQPLHVRLFDMTGRLQRDVLTEIGTIQPLDTHGLQPGTYLLRISTPGGREVTRRVVIL
ncbi:S8 family serine peptidase [Hymenobacter seoulensis]